MLLSPKFCSLLTEKKIVPDDQRVCQSVMVGNLAVGIKILKNVHNFGFSKFIARK